MGSEMCIRDRYWDGSASSLQRLSPDCPPAKVIRNFAERPVIAHTVEGGTTYPHRVRWPTISDETDWTGVGSGYEDLLDTSDFITTMDVLGNQLIVYKERTIVHGYRTGYTVPAITFTGTTRVHGVGCYCPQAFLNLGDEHLFVAADNIYSYNGSSLDYVGEPVKEEFFDRLNPEKLGLVASLYTEETNEWYIFVPYGDSTQLNWVWVFNLKDETFAQGSMPALTGVGFYQREESATWDNVSWTWDTAPGRWDDRRLAAGNPTNLVALSDRKVYELSDEALSHAGTAFEVDVQTPDYTAEDFGYDPDHRITVSAVELTYTSATSITLSCAISTDGGHKWEGEQTVTLEAGETWEVKRKTIYFWSTCVAFRFRMRQENANEAFHITHITLRALDAGRVGE